MKVFIAAILLTTGATSLSAQCYNRLSCDPSTYEIRSQLNVTIPLPEQTSPADAMKLIEDARRQLSNLSDRELDAIKATYGADATLRSANTSTNMQDSGGRGSSAFVSISNSYAVKKPAK